jgi:hypothetical protein
LALKGATGKGYDKNEFMIVKEGTIHGKGWVEVNNGKWQMDFVSLFTNCIFAHFRQGVQGIPDHKRDLRSIRIL